MCSEEVSKYLASGGSKLAALREAVNSDPVLQELAQTPLMLSIMSLACQEVSGNELARQKGDSLEERRRQIFGLYVEQMFQRKGTTPLGFPKEKVIGWLSWLARKMREHSQSVFLVEGLQPSWLGTRAQRVAYGTVLALSLAPIFGLIFGLIGGPIAGLILGLIVPVGVGLGCWSKSPLQNGVASGSIAGLIFGLILGLSGELRSGLSDKLIGGLLFTLTFGVIGGLGIGSLNHVTLVETIDWKWNQFWKGTIPGSVFGLILGLSGGLISSGALRIELSWLINSLIFGLTGGLVSGLIGGVTGRAKAGKVSPNQGIKLSRKNSLAVFVVTWLIFGPIFGLIGVIGGLGSGRGLIFGLIVGLLFGLIFALIGGLNRGGSAVMKHYVLRLILWLRGCTPFNSVEFLDHCAKLILLKKVGGAYIFIHRMLLAYFAELTPEKRSDETAKITQPA